MYKTKLEIVSSPKEMRNRQLVLDLVLEKERERERERESSFSLDFRPFGPSVLDGAKSKVDIRGEG